MTRNLGATFAFTLLLAGCYDTGKRIDGDATTDTTTDSIIDTDTDTGTDTVPDSAPDTHADTVVDTGVDTTPEGCPDVPCPAGEFCESPAGTCDPSLPGTCVAMGDGDCPAIYAPECGCDGVTYGNDCERRYHGVSLLHSGECDEERICAPWLDECEEGEICEAPMDSCDMVGVTGTCQPIRDDCGWLWDPVCGCDDVTYANDCERQQALVWLDHWGECGETCGPDGYPPCSYGTFCEWPTGSCGEWGEGECMAVPMGCPDMWDPVCGCDGITYSNDCDRQAAMAQLRHRGPC